MVETDNSWDERVAACWSRAGEMRPEELVRTIDELASARPCGDARALFERACARDTAGFEADAEPLYRAALAAGLLEEPHRMRAVIQLASTLRLLGRLEESEQLLRAELERAASATSPRLLQDEARAFLALTLLARDKPAEAAAVALIALAPHLTRYTRAVRENAAEFQRRAEAAKTTSHDVPAERC